MGYKPEVHEEPKYLYGYQGDKRKQKAHIIIPRKNISSASNDIGLEKVDKKYVLHISEYDQSCKHFRTERLKQLYAKHRLLAIVKGKSKYSLKSQVVEKDGTIKIRIARMG